MKYSKNPISVAARGNYIARKIAESILGRPLKGSEEVHHVDENPQNNTYSNLVVCPDRVYHMLLHVRTEALNACGNANYRKCNICHEWDDTENLRKSRNVNGLPKYYHASCARMYQRKLREGGRTAAERKARNV